MELLWVFGGHGPEMDSRTYEKGQELLLFLHAGGKASILIKNHENDKNHRISGESQNSAVIPISLVIFLFLMKKALSKRLIFLRK